MTNYKVGTNTSISELIATGGSTTTVTDKYLITTNTTLSYNPSSKAFENPSAFGYKKDGTDIANSIKAKYTDYTTINGSTTEITLDGTIPAWCTQLRFIAIGGGGGGGGGGGDPGGWNSGDIGVSGSGGGGGGLAAAYINRATYPPPYVITIGAGGTGGAYQGSPNTEGNDGSPGSASSVKHATNTTLIIANGGAGGNGGTDPNSGTNTTAGVSGGTGNVLAEIATKYTETGSSSNSATDADLYNATNNADKGPSKGGTVNYGTSVPIIANNTTSNMISPDNNGSWSNPGYGQGGIGGANTDSSNGYAGQDGGDGLVRVYFIK